MKSHEIPPISPRTWENEIIFPLTWKDEINKDGKRSRSDIPLAYINDDRWYIFASILNCIVLISRPMDMMLSQRPHGPEDPDEFIRRIRFGPERNSRTQLDSSSS